MECLGNQTHHLRIRRKRRGEGTGSHPVNGSHWSLGLEVATILSIATSSKLI